MMTRCAGSPATGAGVLRTPLGMWICIGLVMSVTGCAGGKATPEQAGGASRFAIRGPVDAPSGPDATPRPTSLAPELTVDLARELDEAGILRVLGERSPVLAASRARWRAAVARVPQAVSLPDPMIEFGAKYTEGRRGPAEWIYRASQELPFPTKLVTQGEAAVVDAEIAQIEYEAVVRDEIVEAREALFELRYLEDAAETIGQVESILVRYATFAAGELRTGGTTLPENFRAESQLAQLRYDRVLVREMLETERARLRALLGLPPGTALGPARPAPFHPLEATVDDLTALAEGHNQELRRAGRSVDKALAEWSLARQGRIPDLSLDVEVVAPDTGSEPDSVEGMIGMNLPIWEARNAARVREAHALREAAVHDRVAQHSRLQAGVVRLYFRVSNAQRLVALYHDTLIPQAWQAMNAAEELYRAGKASFAATVETAATWYNFQLAWHRAVADHGQALARLEQVIGTTLEIAAPSSQSGEQAR